jgi:hypothetical protein
MLSITMTAADRDEIHETVSASVCSSAPNSFDATGTYTISGGTGRFAAASGAGTWSSKASFTRGLSGTFTTVQAGSISFRDSPGPYVGPTISGLSETRSSFAPSTAHHVGGTVFSVRIDQPARVTIEIELRRPGRRAGRVCRPPSQRLRHNPACTRTVPIGTLAKQAPPGLAKMTFSGRIHGHALKPGRYVAIFTATNFVGTSPPESLRFTVT